MGLSANTRKTACLTLRDEACRPKARTGLRNAPVLPRSTARRTPQRRGSVIVLVAGILVLLLVVAFSYLSRTDAERTLSIAQQQSARADDRERQTGHDIASEIAEALFVRPFDPAFDPFFTANQPRLPIPPNAQRYGFDPSDRIINASGTPGNDGIPDFPYNYAPYETKPWTNWPDDLLADPNDPQSAPRFDDKRGDPGMADSRWLRDTEPHRFLFDWSYPDPTNDDSAELFSHWTHWTYLPRPNNGWLIVPDIRDIARNASVFLQTTQYRVPVEQWLPYIPIAGYDPNLGRTYFRSPQEMLALRDAWYNWFTPQGYERRYNALPQFPNYNDSPPPNLFDLSDCAFDADGIGGNQRLEIGERPEDEFAGPGVLPQFPDGAPRWFVSQLMTDTDGDGLTDAFWHLAPASADGDIRTLVAVSIVDLSALLNVNTSTMFFRGQPTPPDPFAFLRATGGFAPTDIALFDDLPFDANGRPDGTGFFSNRENWEVSFPNIGFFPPDIPPGDPVNSPYGVAQVYWIPNLWDDPSEPVRFLSELNIQQDQTGAYNLRLDEPFFDAATQRGGRLYYWRTTGLRPFDSEDIFTPFTLADELELRKFNGLNTPWSLSAFERAVQTQSNFGLLRAGVGREESSEYAQDPPGSYDRPFNRFIPQPGNPGLYYDELLHDNRRKLTMFNTSRNDLIPPWLRWEMRWPLPDTIAPGSPQAAFFAELTRRKIDLREILRPHPVISSGTGDRSFAQRLAPSLLLALSDQDANPGNFTYDGRTYYGNFGSPDADFLETRRLATAYAANLIEWRDHDDFDLDGVDDGIDLNNNGIADAALSARLFPNPDPNDLLRDPGAATASGALPLLVGVGERVDPNNREYYLGMEAQPFLLEAFIAHVYASAGRLPPGDPDEGQHHVTDNDPDRRTTIVVVQIINPFSRPVDLNQYKLRIFGQEVDFAAPQFAALPKLLGPANEEQPRTAIIYAMEENFDSDPQFGDKWRDFLDIESADLFDDMVGSPDSLLFNATAMLETEDRARYSDENEAIELIRKTPDAVYSPVAVDVVVDRIDNPNDPDEENRYRDAVDDLQSQARFIPPMNDGDDLNGIEGIRIGDDDDRFVVWARVARLWGYNFDGRSQVNNPLEDFERAPRFIFTSHSDGFDPQSRPDMPEGTTYNGKPGDPITYEGDTYHRDDLPDDQNDPWLERSYVDPGGIPRGFGAVNRPARKPTFFPCYSMYDPAQQPVYTRPPIVNGRFDVTQSPNLINLADKGMKDDPEARPGATDDDYFFKYSLQLLDKSYLQDSFNGVVVQTGDFEQIGEILNVWTYGHQVEINPGLPNDPTDDTYVETTQTFSEYMSDALRTGHVDGDLNDPNSPDSDPRRINRLRTEPTIIRGTETRFHGQVVGIAPPIAQDQNFRHPYHAVPALPAGVRALGLFVCDGPGADPPNIISPAFRRFANAGGFTGIGTPGMININTAPVEVLRALPHFFRLVHQSAFNEENPSAGTNYVQHQVPEALVAYRDLMGGEPTPQAPLGEPPIPGYGTRGWPPQQQPTDPLPYIELMRSDRGFVEPGELMLLQLPGRALNNGAWNAGWQIDMPAFPLMLDTNGMVVDVDLSTDRTNRFVETPSGVVPVRDDTARDAEEANLLYAGISNLITTRSDAFVVYFKVRNVRRDPVTGIWDGTNKELIIDESRYVMIVDRSQVNRPTDEPRILLFEKLPR